MEKSKSKKIYRRNECCMEALTEEQKTKASALARQQAGLPPVPAS
jgi:hypothetical protein